MARALRLLRSFYKWAFLLGTALAALGLIGCVLYFFHLPSSFLVDLGIMALPAFFLGSLLVFLAMVLDRIVARRSTSS
jgi:hypothetical protein